MNTTDEVAADESLAVIQRILNTPHLLDPNHGRVQAFAA